MSKKLSIFLFLMINIEVIAQSAYHIPRFIPSTYETIHSHQGIVVKGITINQDSSMTITFENVNVDERGEILTYSFEWYLSYKGKRVTDYYTDALRCGKTTSHTIYIWPGEVPFGHEKFITVQLGREQKKEGKDRRDDF